jgi:predicted  nucleic acid-binding Zn-ribbon protein
MAAMAPATAVTMPRFTIPRVAHCAAGELTMITNRQLLTQITILSQKLDVLMSQQDEINTDVQAIEAGVAQLNTAATAIQAEIAALKQANPALDLTALDKAAADLNGAVNAVAAIAPPAA